MGNHTREKSRIDAAPFVAPLAGPTVGIVVNEHTDEDGAVVFRHA